MDTYIHYYTCCGDGATPSLPTYLPTYSPSCVDTSRVITVFIHSSIQVGRQAGRYRCNSLLVDGEFASSRWRAAVVVAQHNDDKLHVIAQSVRPFLPYCQEHAACRETERQPTAWERTTTTLMQQRQSQICTAATKEPKSAFPCKKKKRGREESVCECVSFLSLRTRRVRIHIANVLLQQYVTVDGMGNDSSLQSL